MPSFNPDGSRRRNWLRERWNTLHSMAEVDPVWADFEAFRAWCESQGLTRDGHLFRLDPEQPHSPDNTRVGTKQTNAITQGLKSSNTTGVKGVRYRKDRDKFEAMLMVDGKQYHGQLRDTLEEAARDRAELERRYHQPLLEAAS